jgi:hypothetical protein
MAARVKLRDGVHPRLDLFGPPLLIEGEDAATYDDLLANMLAAVKPVDVIEEMFIADVVSLEWEVLRWRRLKTSLIRLRGLAALEAFLREHLNDALYSDLVAERLTEILQDEDDLFRASDDVFQASDAQKLAHQYVRNEPNAVDRVENAVDPGRLEWILKDARDRKVEDLVLGYVRHEPDAVTLVDEHLADAGMSLDHLLANALAGKLDDIERIDRLTAVAEGRRNASLREIDRRRILLGEALRRAVQELEERERKLLEAPAEGEKAA